MIKGIFIIFIWVLLIVICIYLLEYLSKRKVRIDRNLKAVLLLTIDSYDEEIESKLSKAVFQMRDITARGVQNHILVLSSLKGEEKEHLKSACYYRGVIFLESNEDLIAHLEKEGSIEAK